MAELHDLVRRLAGGDRQPSTPKAAPVSADFVEKLASAVEYLIDEEPPRRAQVITAPTPSDLTEALRAGLARRMEQKKTAEAATSPNAKDAILARLRGLRVAADQVVPAQNDVIPEEDAEDSLFYSGDEDEVSGSAPRSEAQDPTSELFATDEDSGESEKSAETAPTLADVLAASLGGNEPNKSTTSGGVKTAGVRGDVGPMAREDAIKDLKRSLLAKVGREVRP